MKEVYSHHPTPPVPPAAFQGAESPALLHLPQSLGLPSLWHPGTGSPGPFCSKLPKRKHLDTHPLLTWWLWSPGWQKCPVGFHFHRQKVPVKGSGSCTWHPSLVWGCWGSVPRAPQSNLWAGTALVVMGGLRDGDEQAGVSPDHAAASAQLWPCHLLQMEGWRRTGCE